jgi:Chromo (CHRromatin Organisation MOdifier) domain
MKELNILLAITTKLSMAYHPQTDGQAERMNKEIEQYLHLFVDYQQANWPEWLAIAEFSYNNKFQASLCMSPFYANYRYNPWMEVEPRQQAKVQSVDDFLQQLKDMQKEAEVALHKACDNMTHWVDWSCMQAPNYKPGDLIWLSTKDLQTQWPSRKLMEKQIGPYPITKIINLNVVKLKLSPSFEIQPEINITCIQPYKQPTILGQQVTPQPPIKVEGISEYVVEEILDAQLWQNKLEFLVKWEGYTDENNSWEPKTNCRNACDAICDFYHKYPNVLWHIVRMQFDGMVFQP